jgi:hypothetical protein
MPMRIVKGGSPTFSDGNLIGGGGEEFTRVQTVVGRLKQTSEITGTQPHALVITATRDVTQGTPADLLAHKTMYGKEGRPQKAVFPLSVLIFDDVRNGKPALVGTIKCAKEIIARILTTGGTQSITFHASEWVCANAISGQSEPSDQQLVPVVARGFDEKVDKST